ncbi:MAG: hypothetical protein NTY38_12955, partial [Acidobacteria bacterium]|nr:hypothetical protein [Acidobacteriota bacterium]
MSFPLSYSIDGQARLDRLRCLYTERPQDRIFAAMEIPAGAIERFAERYRAGYAARPAIDERIAFWDELLRERMAVLDDTVPCAYLSEQDQGLYGGIVGGSIQYMAHTENGWISSMVPPILSDWGGFGALDAEAESEPWRYYLEQLTRFREHAGGRFGISHFILIDSLNF